MSGNILIFRYDDDGDYLGNPFGINRETGEVVMGRLKVAGQELMSVSLDVRTEATRPTENLQMGTIWVISAGIIRDYDLGNNIYLGINRDFDLG